MHTGHRYKLGQTLYWSKKNFLLPLVWAALVTAVYAVGEVTWIAIPTLPLSLVGGAVAFYLGFKNNASYDRLWEARKIWGAIVNASRSWAFSVRDLVTQAHGGDVADDAVTALHTELVLRHVAWMDALRHQLRQIKSWEHAGPTYERWRKDGAVEYSEDLVEVLTPNLPEGEPGEVTDQLNPAAHLLANQSKRLSQLRAGKLLDGFAHMHLQALLVELMTQQGKAERIKNFPFPRQYATVNSFFAGLFALLLPFGLIPEFAGLGANLVWLAVPFSAVVSWVFLTTDQIGEWSENPFEGLANDVPITSMARGIERDIRQMIGQTELPPARPQHGSLQY